MWCELVLCLTFLTCINAGFNPYKKIISKEVHGDCGDPAFLTPYIEKEDIAGAREACTVPPFMNNIESYSGFFTVNKEYNSNIYFWFFPAERYKEHAPVVVWLQGGPGASSLFGLFSENGAYYLNKSEKLEIRQHYWSQISNVIYIDNPVGTGFSFTQNENGYVKDQEGVGKDLYSAITQFYTVFPEYLKNDLYIFGESYGGKYAPAMAFAIHENSKKNNKPKINLKGVGIGNGFTDPINMLVYSDYLYQIGLIDTNGKIRFEKAQNDIKNAFESQNFTQASDLQNSMIGGLFNNLAGSINIYNYLHSNVDSTDGDLGKFLENEDIRKALNVGNLTYNGDSHKVGYYLEADSLKTVLPWFKTLVENYRVLVYNGQLDIICAYPLTVNYLKKLEWSGASEYKNAPRDKWYVGNELAGYVKKVKGLTEVLVRNSGHMVPQDQPLWALELLRSFIYNKF